MYHETWLQASTMDHGPSLLTLLPRRWTDSKLRKFYLRVRARKGANVAILALARKILCILHHLLTNQEMYEEPGVTKRSRLVRTDQLSPPRKLTAQDD